MADSLLLANTIELLGGEAVSTNPRCPGAKFMLAPGFSLGSPQPTSDYVASLVLDGERPFGRRASNRTIVLPIIISAPSRAILAAARELLEQTIDAQTWTLTWTRDPGPGGTPLPLVLDCFRAEPSVPVYNTSYEKQANVGQLTITFQALPYGRSDTQQQIAFAAPVPASPPPPPPPVVLDNFQSISSGTFSQSPRCVVGPWTACWDPDDPRVGDPGGSRTPLTYGATFTAPLNLTSMVSLQLWFGMGSRYYWNLHDRGGRLKVNFYVTLTDTSGNTLSCSRSGRTLPSSADANNPAFSRVTLGIPQGSTAFLYGSVASYSMTVTSRDSSPCLRWVTGYLDALTAYPLSQTVTPVVRGSVYTLYGVQGTAHTPVSLQFQQAPTPGTPSTITTVGAGSYTVPAGTAWLKVECTGGGGAGASQTVTGVGGGGGGGEYAAETVFPASPAQVVPYSVGAGGTSGVTPANGQASVFGPGPSGPLAVTANGGLSAAQNSITGVLGGSGSGNSVEHPGGTGRTASGSVGGGGGSSAGTASAGLTPVGTSAVILTGSGTWTAPAGVTQVTVYAVGGGGGAGSGSSSTDGSGGGGGESATQTFTVVPGNAYTYTVGAGGTGGAGTGGGGNPGTAGASTTFTVGAVTLTAHAGAGGVSSSRNAGGGNGGSGSTAPAHYSGGQGGSCSPYGGGGGSSAGTAAAGNNGNGYGNPGIAPSGGGNGGAGSTSGAGASGIAPGGGGGGNYVAAAGGNGAAGTLTVSYPGGGAPTSSGGVAVAGGGAGGAGGPSANTAGSAGSAPGGAGGGADSTGTSEAGGAGAAGRIIITPYASLPFKSLIVHRPAPDSPAMFTPLVPAGNGLVAPGATEYPVPSPIAPVPLNTNSTFTTSVTPWTAAGSATLSQSTTWQTSGSALFTGNGTTANPAMASETTIPVTPGQSYTAQANCYSPQGFATVQVIIAWFTSAGGSAGASTSSVSTSVPAGVTFGTPVQVTGTAPAAAASAQMTVQMTGTPAVTVQMFADNTVLAATPPAADFDGTYTIILIASAWNTPTAARTISVTVKQYEMAGGASYSATTTPVTVSPGVASTFGPGNQVNNGILVAGVLTLPLKAVAPDNTSGYYTVSVTDSNTADRFYDVIFADSMGQTVIINEPTTGYITYMLDEPDPTTDLGRHLGSQLGRPNAISVMDACQAISGGPLTVPPNESTMFCYSADGTAPAIGVSYYARYFLDRTT